MVLTRSQRADKLATTDRGADELGEGLHEGREEVAGVGFGPEGGVGCAGEGKDLRGGRCRVSLGFGSYGEMGSRAVAASRGGRRRV